MIRTLIVSTSMLGLLFTAQVRPARAAGAKVTLTFKVTISGGDSIAGNINWAQHACVQGVKVGQPVTVTMVAEPGQNVQLYGSHGCYDVASGIFGITAPDHDQQFEISI